MSFEIGDIVKNRFLKGKKAEVIAVNQYKYEEITVYKLRDIKTNYVDTWDEYEISRSWKKED